jgi:hypothetical protein
VYVINNQVDVEFVLDPNDSPLIITDFDIAILKPDGTRTYTDSGLTSYTAPTATVQGWGMTQHTPDQLGRWRYTFSTGTEGNYVEYSTIEIFVVAGDFAITNQTSMVRPIVTKVFGSTSTLLSNTAWLQIIQIIKHPSDPNLVIVLGKPNPEDRPVYAESESDADRYKYIGTYNLTTQSYDSIIRMNNPVGTNGTWWFAHSIAVNSSGRYVVLDYSGHVNNRITNYYSTNLIDWTIGTWSSSQTIASNNTNGVFYIDTFDEFWWNNGTTYFISFDGIDFDNVYPQPLQGYLALANPLWGGDPIVWGIPGYTDYLYMVGINGMVKIDKSIPVGQWRWQNYPTDDDFPWATAAAKMLFWDGVYINSVNETAPAVWYRAIPSNFDTLDWEQVDVSANVFLNDTELNNRSYMYYDVDEGKYICHIRYGNVYASDTPTGEWTPFIVPTPYGLHRTSPYENGPESKLILHYDNGNVVTVVQQDITGPTSLGPIGLDERLAVCDYIAHKVI